MNIPVDGLCITTSQLTTNEAAMTGESDARHKETLATCIARRAEAGVVDYKKVDKTESHAIPSPVLLSGTNIAGGEGKMICIVVGDNSAIGQILSKLEKKDSDTPL